MKNMPQRELLERHVPLQYMENGDLLISLWNGLIFINLVSKAASRLELSGLGTHCHLDVHGPILASLNGIVNVDSANALNLCSRGRLVLSQGCEYLGYDLKVSLKMEEDYVHSQPLGSSDESEGSCSEAA